MLVRNELMALLHLKDWEDVKEDCQIPEYPQEYWIKSVTMQWNKKIIEDGVTDRDILIQKLWENLLLSKRNYRNF